MEKVYEIDAVEDVVCKVNDAIYRISCLPLPHEGIKISMPKYFLEMVFRNNKYMKYFATIKDAKIFGYDVIPSYENHITVFHEDMPLRNDKNYIVINL